jgi:hypothetical protein
MEDLAAGSPGAAEVVYGCGRAERVSNCVINLFTLIVIPGLTEPALACPVLDTGYLIRGNPVFLPLWIPAGVYPVRDTGQE